MSPRRIARRVFAIALVAMLACVGNVWAQEEGDGEPVGDPVSGKALNDRRTSAW